MRKTPKVHGEEKWRMISQFYTIILILYLSGILTFCSKENWWIFVFSIICQALFVFSLRNTQLVIFFYFYQNFQTYFFFSILNLLFYCLTSVAQVKHVWCDVYQISIFPYKLYGILMNMWCSYINALDPWIVRTCVYWANRICHLIGQWNWLALAEFCRPELDQNMVAKGQSLFR